MGDELTKKLFELPGEKQKTESQEVRKSEKTL
jgi:hypothetical protein